MSKINWKLRLQNKTTLVALIALVVSFVYQLLNMFGVVPSVSQSDVMDVLTLLVQILLALGVVVDPTTAGISDSDNALSYNNPKKSE